MYWGVLITLALNYRQNFINSITWLIMALILLFCISSAIGQEYGGVAAKQNLSLEIYLYNTGKTLVVGYVDDPSAILSLKPIRCNAPYPYQRTAEYSYDIDTHQLYAWTDCLTRKNGEIWSLEFASLGSYGQCRVVFHLPGDLRLGRINSSNGLDYMIFASNESLLVDASGHSVKKPSIRIEYQQPVGTEPLVDLHEDGIDQGSISEIILPIAPSLSILLAVSAIYLFSRRPGEKLPDDASRSELSSAENLPKSMDPNSVAVVATVQAHATEDCMSIEAVTSADMADDGSANEDAEDYTLEEVALSEGEHPESGNSRVEIEISSEMAAVMQTLTERERTILKTLISHGGRMTQTEIRYETGSPKSSLAMILFSLEKRRLITKREWGRTNVIELSEWFFSKKPS